MYLDDTWSHFRPERYSSRESSQQRINIPPNPSRWVTRDFSIWQRERALEVLANTPDNF